MQGRHVRIKGAGEDIDVAVGTTGYNRNDLVALHYKQEGGIESVSVEVVAGTPTTGAASDPELGGGSILNGDAEAYVAIARVPIVGLAPSEPVVLVGGLKSNSQLAESISAIRDSVSRPLFKTVKYTSPNSDVGSGNVLEYSGTLENFAGYTPVGIVETNTNHDWSFGLMRATLNGDGTFTCTWMNFNKNTWRGSIGYATVLYIRS